MVSDQSVDELQAFARGVDLDDRLFQGDHYDVPEELRDVVLAAGAQEVDSREIVRRLRAAGLRLTPARRRGATAMPPPPAGTASR